MNPDELRSVAATISESQPISSAQHGPQSDTIAAAMLAKQQLSRFLTITDINNFNCPSESRDVALVCNTRVSEC